MFQSKKSSEKKSPAAQKPPPQKPTSLLLDLDDCKSNSCVGFQVISLTSVQERRLLFLGCARPNTVSQFGYTTPKFQIPYWGECNIDVNIIF
jgi:hypothetical protein